jgi:hypothetical protein
MTRREQRGKLRSARFRATLTEPHAGFNLAPRGLALAPVTKCPTCGEFRSSKTHRAHMPRSVQTL